MNYDIELLNKFCNQYLDEVSFANVVINNAKEEVLTNFKPDFQKFFQEEGIFKKDICKGLNLNLAKDILTKKSWLKSKASTPKRVQGEVKKVYVFTSDLWGEEC